jgi:hypothetical protein
MNDEIAFPFGDVPSALALALFLVVAAVLPALGYIYMYVDFRAYLRSLRRAIALVRNYLPQIPQWARQETPRCLSAFGLSMPCTLDDLKSAYRRKVKTLHPDRGGDRRKFLTLQGHFEQAERFLLDNLPRTSEGQSPSS